jgi:hypothetical protein
VLIQTLVAREQRKLFQVFPSGPLSDSQKRKTFLIFADWVRALLEGQ